jgi:hypothetical protein
MTMRTGTITVIDVNERHGVGRTRNYQHAAKVKAALLRSLNPDELAKQQVNRKRASGPGKAGGQ